MSVRIPLYDAHFGEAERTVCTFGEFTVTSFRYRSGVAGLRIRNVRGEVIVLPFKGQQVWRAAFDGRELTMRSMFDEPVETRTYLETYGAFLIHCGLTGLGAPSANDTHPLHGELPNAPMGDAWLDISEDGASLAVGGTFKHTVAFSTNYIATLETKISAGSALLDVALWVENLKQSPMDLMYLAHANFCPVDNGELDYCAAYDPDAVRVRRSIPSHVSPKPGYVEFLTELAADPVKHHVFEPGLAFDPEVVFEIDMTADEDGFTHALQRHPDGTADYVRYRPDQAPLAMRWICRTPDQDGLGIAFPATSGVEGYSAEKAKGRVVCLDGGQTWNIDMRFGLLTADEAKERASANRAIRDRLWTDARQKEGN